MIIPLRTIIPNKLTMPRTPVIVKSISVIHMATPVPKIESESNENNVNAIRIFRKCHTMIKNIIATATTRPLRSPGSVSITEAASPPSSNLTPSLAVNFFSDSKCFKARSFALTPGETSAEIVTVGRPFLLSRAPSLNTGENFAIWRSGALESPP